MTTKDILAAVIMAGWLLDAKDPRATFWSMLPRVRDSTSSDIDDGALYELASAFAGFGATVRGDFKDVPRQA
ncbi:MAG: hypothetical protein E5X80_04895 [Mesorhizobium sp.]|uniref:hypothetical protein n=1 Tax=Mesorhizobium sp. TaxID=1871066 RepID=UPI00120889CB|nr:hypothetical protein [Mesorhizobium sp.]TIO52996.1 MAG: hypothetical protein E5X78_10150 [Mesorhizobium sp.]TIO61829.1 MAG: hypothetical protein E5X79_05530 [Mesorhizobium sp.]TJV66716.1 MAG: hypothetical protein E5X80_04895 [Mesorhizobium sp.]